MFSCVETETTYKIRVSQLWDTLIISKLFLSDDFLVVMDNFENLFK